jgi:hypothetical protein
MQKRKLLLLHRKEPLMSRERRNKPEPVQITAVVIDDIAKIMAMHRH